VSTGRFVLRPSAAANLDAIEDYLSEHASADIARRHDFRIVVRRPFD
jgi:hypothetical protein